MRKRIFTALFFVSLCAAVFPAADTNLTITEVMFNAPSGNNEFIEIYNLSATDSIDLYGFKLQYASTTPDIICTTHKYLKPKLFAVVFEGDYDTTSGIYRSRVPANAMILKISDNSFGSSGMSNVNDNQITLLNLSNTALDTYTYSANNQPGYSDEKILLKKDNSLSNWTNARFLYGSPGKSNTVTPLLFDMWLRSFSISASSAAIGSVLSFNAVIENYGINATSDYTVRLYRDANYDSIPQSTEQIDSKAGIFLMHYDTAVVTFSYMAVDTGRQIFITKVDYPPDDNPADNIAFSSAYIYQRIIPRSALVINEIMYAPASGRPEWIELYNRSSQTFDLKRCKISDRLSTISLPAVSAVIAPHTYAVIAKDSSIFNSYTITSPVIVANIPSLNNDSDLVIFSDSLRYTIDSVSYNDSWGGNNGNSLERINVDSSSNSPANWKSCRDVKYGTPGKINSVSQKYIDVSVEQFQPQNAIIQEDDPAVFNSTIFNAGKNLLSNIQIKLYQDFNGDSLFQWNELIDQRTISNLAVGQTIGVSFTVEGLMQGSHHFGLFAKVQNDEDSLNDGRTCGVKVFRINEMRNDIVINEIMYAPPSGEPEWIELYNRSAKMLNIKSWRIADANDTIQITNKNILLPPSAYLVLSDDSAIVQHYAIPSPIILCAIPSLNNTGDRIILLDSLNRVIDSLYYLPSWGGNNGRSLERIDANNSSTDSTNWRTAKSRFRATPGMINSMTMKNYDLTLAGVEIIPSFPVVDDSIGFSIRINNAGKNSCAGDLRVYAYAGSNRQLIYQNSFASILPNDSLKFVTRKLTNISKEEYFYFIIQSANDEDTTDNWFLLKVTPIQKADTALITEIMFSPANDEPEWFELYNPTNDTIDLKGWRIHDLFTTPSYATFSQSFIILPHQYAVVTKDSSIYQYYHHPFAAYKLSSMPILNNDEDGIVLLDNHNRTIDSVRYSYSGTILHQSLEKKDVLSPNISSNWLRCKSRYGATPGYINSVTEKNIDGVLSSIIITPQYPNTGDRLSASITLRNNGKHILSSGTLQLQIKCAGIDSSIIKPINTSIPSKDSTMILVPDFITMNIDSITIAARVIVLNDEDTSNNYLSINVLPGYASGSMIINEVMYYPNEKQSEWIELFNPTSQTINLKNWTISDMITTPQTATISTTDLFMPSGSYIVIARDSIPQLSAGSYLIRPFGTLNDDGDGILLCDARGRVIDSMQYNSQSGKVRGRSLERISSAGNITQWIISFGAGGSTPGKLNSSSSMQPAARSIVINEIMYEPGADNSEYIELYNTSAISISLAGMKLFVNNSPPLFICDTTVQISSTGYYVVASDSIIFKKYPRLSSLSNTYITNSNGLGLLNSGAGIRICDYLDNTIDSVIYSPDWHSQPIRSTSNRSLEKINPLASGNDRRNWSTSASVEGGTPVLPNSILTLSAAGDSKLELSPNPFSPDNDGWEDVTMIRYRLPYTSAMISIKLFDDHGRMAKHIVNNEYSTSIGNIVYNGLNEDNNPLPIGMYIVLLEAADAQTGNHCVMKAVLVSARKMR